MTSILPHLLLLRRPTPHVMGQRCLNVNRYPIAYAPGKSTPACKEEQKEEEHKLRRWSIEMEKGNKVGLTVPY